jgi:hypothetical protein
MHALVLYCIALSGKCGSPASKELMRVIGIASIHQCNAMHNNLGAFSILLVYIAKTAHITICLAFQCNKLVLFKCALLKQCNTNTRKFIVSPLFSTTDFDHVWLDYLKLVSHLKPKLHWFFFFLEWVEWDNCHRIPWVMRFKIQQNQYKNQSWTLSNA